MRGPYPLQEAGDDQAANHAVTRKRRFSYYRIASPLVATMLESIKVVAAIEVPPRHLRYRHQGSLATIGRKSAVADFGRVRLTGALAWWLWGAVHILFLAARRNQFSVILGWLWSYFTFDVGVRLITGDGPFRAGAALAAEPLE